MKLARPLTKDVEAAIKKVVACDRKYMPRSILDAVTQLESAFTKPPGRPPRVKIEDVNRLRDSGITLQREIAESLGCHQTSVSRLMRIKNGKSDEKPETEQVRDELLGTPVLVD